MSSQDGREALNMNIPPEDMELIEEYAERNGLYLWEAVSEMAHQAAGGERLNSISAVERELEQERRKIRNLKEEINDCEEALGRREQRVEELLAHRERLDEEQASYTDEMDALLNDMESMGMSVYVGHTRVTRLSRQEYHGANDDKQEQVIGDLIDRAAERGLDLPESRFEEGTDNGGPWA